MNVCKDVVKRMKKKNGPMVSGLLVKTTQYMMDLQVIPGD